MSGRNVAASDSGIAPSGERHGPAAKPSSFIAHLIGIGDVVAKIALKSGCKPR